MASRAETVRGWLIAIKTGTGQRAFVEHDLKHAITFVNSIKREQLTEIDVKLVRLLRNCAPLGEGAVKTIIRGGLVPAVVHSLRSTLHTSTASGASPAAPSSDGIDTAFLAACAQLLANLASAGSIGAAEVWVQCFPTVFFGLLMHPSAQVHEATTLALYACCRQDLSRSRELCGAVKQAAAVRSVFSMLQPNAATIGTAPGSGTEYSIPSSAAIPEAAAAAVAPATAVAAATVDAAAAARAIWEALLGRLLVSEPQAAGGEQHNGGGGASCDWTALLCGCVALRQGLLGPLLAMLAPSPSLSSPSPSSLMPWVTSSGGDAVAEAGPGPAASSTWHAMSNCTPATTSLSASETSTAGRFPGTLWPVLLHVLAQELYELKGGGAVDIGDCWADEEQGGAGEAAATCEWRLPGGGNDGGGGGGGGTPLPAESVTAASGRMPGSRQEAVTEAESSGCVIGTAAPDPTGLLTPHAATCRPPTDVPTTAKCLDEGAPPRGGGGSEESAISSSIAVRLVMDTAGQGDASAAAAATAAAASSAAVDWCRAASPLSTLPLAARPVASALLRVAEVVEAAARCLADGGKARGMSKDGGRGVIGQPGDCGGGGGASSGVATAAPAAAGQFEIPGGAAGSRAVLEAGLEVLKSVTQREDGGRALTGGSTDLAEWLLCKFGGDLLSSILGMLAAMQPAAALRNASRWRGGAGDAATAGLLTSDRPVVELPHTLKALAAGFPVDAPYIGYRGDLVSVLSNGVFRRPRVVSELLAGGGLELLLAQTHLDEHSPLAREWALWGVRNMCEASEEVQSRIAGLELNTAVETPELQKLGLKLELDKSTGKLKVSKTDEARELLA